MNNEEAEYILSFFKEIMPQYPISKENLLRPTPELVFRFYSTFISEYQDRPSFLAGTSANILDVDSESMDPEERLFQKMSQKSKLFEKAGMTFMHGDLYEPTLVRTKNLFRICIHFLSYSEQILEDTERLGNDIRKMRDDTLRMKEEQQHLMVSINETAKTKAELLESVDKLASELKTVTNSQEEYVELKAKKEKANSDKKKQIEVLTRELQKEEYELKRLELQEKDYTEQTITENEHKSLLKMLDSLENEIKSLGNDDVDMADILLHENHVLEHYQACLKRLPDVSEFNIEVVLNLIKCEELLNDLELNTEKLQNTKLATLRQSKSQKEKLLKEVEYLLSKSDETNKISFLKDKEELLGQVEYYKADMEARFQRSSKNISSYMDNSNKLKSDMEKIRQQFSDEYITFCKAEKSATDMFTKHLLELQNLNKILLKNITCDR